MPARKANSSGRWSQSIWDVTPTAGDDVFANGFTVEIDVPIVVSSLRTTLSSGYAAAGGSFTLLSAISSVVANSAGFVAGTTACLSAWNSTGTSFLTGNCTGGSAGGAYGVALAGTGNLTLSGNILGGTNSTAYGAFHNSTGNLTIVGNVSGSATATGVFHNSTGNISVLGNIQGGTAASIRGIQNNSVGNVYINGNCLGGTNGTAQAVINSSVGAVIINGNITANAAPGVEQSSTGTVLIDGDIRASVNQNGFVSSNVAARNEITGALYNSLSGMQALYVARYLLKPKPFNSFTYHQNAEAVNLLTWSENFDNAVWSLSGGTVTANLCASPINTSLLSGDRFTELAVGGGHLIRRTIATNLSSGFTPQDLVLSVFARAQTGQRQYMVLGIDTGAGHAATTPTGASSVAAMFDLIGGTVTSLTATGAGVPILSSIESFGNGWWRCMIEGRFAALSSSGTTWNTFPTIAISDRANFSTGTWANNFIPTYTGATNISGIGLFGAQYQYNTLSPYFSSDSNLGFGNLVPPVFFYSPEAYDLSYVPHVSSVRFGTTYAAVSALSGQPVGIPAQLEGIMHVPSSLVVALSTAVDNTIGTALTQSVLLNYWNSDLNALSANSIGERIKNAVQIQDIGEQFGSINI